MDGMHFPLKKWAVRAIQTHIDTHYIEMMSMNHTTNFNHIMQIAFLPVPICIRLFMFPHGIGCFIHYFGVSSN